MSTHTQGPWHHYRDQGSSIRKHVIQPLTGGCTKYAVTMILQGASNADAALIASAPELLALVERAVSDRIDDAWLATARTVLEKAKLIEER